MNEREWLTAAEAAQRLRISKASVYRLVESRRLAGVKLGRTVRIHAAALDALAGPARNAPPAAA